MAKVMSGPPADVSWKQSRPNCKSAFSEAKPAIASATEHRPHTVIKIDRQAPEAISGRKTIGPCRLLAAVGTLFLFVFCIGILDVCVFAIFS